MIPLAFAYTDTQSVDPRFRHYHPPQDLSAALLAEMRDSLRAVLPLVEACDDAAAVAVTSPERNEASDLLDAALEIALSRADAGGYRRHFYCELLARIGEGLNDCNWRMPT